MTFRPFLAWFVASPVPGVRRAAEIVYRVRFWGPVWLWWPNAWGRWRHLRTAVDLTADQVAAARTLADNGVVVCRAHVDDPDVWTEAERLMACEPAASQIERGRAEGSKPFQVRTVRAPAILRLNDPLAKVVLDEHVLAIVSEYLGVWPRLKSFDLWCNLPSAPDCEAIYSQLWHRDYEDRRLVKLFVYLGETDEASGAFSYVIGSHPGGRLAGVEPARPLGGRVCEAGAVERHVDPQLLRVIAGAPGDLILADTAGLHRGGLTTTRRRVVLTATYGTAACVRPDEIVLDPHADLAALGARARFAVRAPTTAPNTRRH